MCFAVLKIVEDGFLGNFIPWSRLMSRLGVERSGGDCHFETLWAKLLLNHIICETTMIVDCHMRKLQAADRGVGLR